uniref:Proteasome alpha-type subunits domain-containing protein n=1 Tax=Arcella intermedia TaxID=1963864 RepID=A0A6B2LFC3_9EUKA
MEAVKRQGSPSVGLKSKTHAVVVGLQRASSSLSSYQKKIFDVDEHIGISISGLTADARVLCKWLRTECLNYRYVYEGEAIVGRLVKKLADKHQTNTQRYGRRPYGVGLLIVGYDTLGPHLYETDPSGNYFDFKAQSVGARSQSARTYLEKHFQSFENASREDLIRHGLRALRECLTEKKNEKDKEPDTLDEENCSVGIVGKDEKFTVLTKEQLRHYLDTLDKEPETMEVV